MPASMLTQVLMMGVLRCVYKCVYMFLGIHNIALLSRLLISVTGAIAEVFQRHLSR